MKDRVVSTGGSAAVLTIVPRSTRDVSSSCLISIV